MLSDDERDRAARLASAPRWIVARAALRIVLAGRLGTHPSDVEFDAGPHGKPEIAGSALRFNLSHSGDLAADRAEHRGRGRNRRRAHLAPLAGDRAHAHRRRAGGAERARPPHDLLRMWCRKEALAKAGGGGLGWAPETFDTTAPGPSSLSDLLLEPGYVGALAVEGSGRDIALYRVVFTGS